MIRQLILFFFVLTSCNINQDKFLVTNIGKAQGTYYNIKYVSSSNIDYQNKIDSILDKIDKESSKIKNDEYDELANKIII